LRDLGGFAGAGGGHQNQAVIRRERAHDLSVNLPDGKGSLHNEKNSPARSMEQEQSRQNKD